MDGMVTVTIWYGVLAPVHLPKLVAAIWTGPALAAPVQPTVAYKVVVNVPSKFNTDFWLVAPVSATQLPIEAVIADEKNKQLASENKVMIVFATAFGK